MECGYSVTGTNIVQVLWLEMIVFNSFLRETSTQTNRFHCVDLTISVRLSVSLSVCPSVSLSGCPLDYYHRPARSVVTVLLCLSVSVSVCLSVSLSVCMCACLCQTYVQLKPHVLSTPVIDDVNSDGITEELVVAVSYYLDEDDR